MTDAPLIRSGERKLYNGVVFLSWQDRQGENRSVRGRCVDISPSGAKVQTTEPLEVRSTVSVRGENHGFFGTATVRHCSRVGAKYMVGLEFSAPPGVADAARKRLLAKLK
jgi:hypothetical protein